MNQIEEFISKCREVATKLGRPDSYYDGTAKISCVIPFEDQTKTYEDDKIAIIVSLSSQAMLVRKLNNNNPIVCIHSDGDVYRIHGQMWQLKQHLEELYDRFNIGN